MSVRPAPALRRYMPRDFEISYDPPLDLAALPEQVRLLPFLWQVAPIVWAADLAFEVELLDPRVANSFEAVRTRLRAMYPSIGWNGEIRARALVAPPDPPPSALTKAALFSGGVDSTWTAIKHRGDDLLLITIWGTHVAPRDRKSWAKVAAKNEAFAAAHAGGFARVKANLKELNYLQLRTFSPEISHWWTLVQHAMAYTGVTAPILYRHGIDTLLIAVGFHGSSPWRIMGLKPGAGQPHQARPCARQSRLIRCRAAGKDRAHRRLLPRQRNATVGTARVPRFDQEQRRQLWTLLQVRSDDARRSARWRRPDRLRLSALQRRRRRADPARLCGISVSDEPDLPVAGPAAHGATPRGRRGSHLELVARLRFRAIPRGATGSARADPLAKSCTRRSPAASLRDRASGDSTPAKGRAMRPPS